MGETQENWVTCQNDWSPCLKYHPQLKTKEDVEGEEESVIGGYQEQHSKQG